MRTHFKEFLASLFSEKIAENVMKAFHFHTGDLSTSQDTLR